MSSGQRGDEGIDIETVELVDGKRVKGFVQCKRFKSNATVAFHHVAATAGVFMAHKRVNQANLELVCACKCDFFIFSLISFQ